MHDYSLEHKITKCGDLLYLEKTEMTEFPNNIFNCGWQCIQLGFHGFNSVWKRPWIKKLCLHCFDDISVIYEKIASEIFFFALSNMHCKIFEVWNWEQKHYNFFILTPASECKRHFSSWMILLLNYYSPTVTHGKGGAMYLIFSVIVIVLVIVLLQCLSYSFGQSMLSHVRVLTFVVTCDYIDFWTLCFAHHFVYCCHFTRFLIKFFACLYLTTMQILWARKYEYGVLFITHAREIFKSLVFDSWTPYSHFLLTVFTQCIFLNFWQVCVNTIVNFFQSLQMTPI